VDLSVLMRVLFLSTSVWMLVALVPYNATAATSGTRGKVSATTASNIDGAASDDLAAVTLDGEVLFQVPGVTAYPAAERAQAIRQRIEAIAADRSIAIDSLRVVEMEDRSKIVADDRLVVAFVEFDAAAEGISRQILAEQARIRIAAAIASYRKERSPRVLLIRTAYALGATVGFVLLLLLFRGAFQRLDELAERRLRFHVKRLEARSHQLIQAQQLIRAVHGLLKFLGILSVLAAAYVYAHLVLSLYPWTRPMAM